MLLKAKGERSCAIGYFAGRARNGTGYGGGLVVWNTSLFVGDFYDHFTSKEYSGAISILFPAISAGPEYLPPTDATTIERYRNRKTLGVIE